MRFWVKWSVWLSLSLMAWTIAAESTHHHPTRADSSSCLICVVAHSANPAPNSADSTPAFAAVGLLQEEAVAAKIRLEFADLGNRGPPIL